ncbi:hypothetical protein [Sutcliffiella horikoshii]|uniref:hypothetical protein n=1 Tax=Sutcliffiella horikoshii TaxID=79883 RepID=UPI001CBAF44F|nr:hypothetical protein [Sutcliffiella horikoshii]UAL49251.1 hypothetical protein K7887_10080 [Sutcliffiella horikoshii]
MAKVNHPTVTAEMIEKYYECNKQKREIEKQMEELKERFHLYFDKSFGEDEKAEVVMGGYKLQRQVRKSEKYSDETISKLEALKMTDLIKTVKKPDDAKIKAAIQLNLINEKDLEGCLVTSSSLAISVKPLTPK